ncbi:MAG TPA: hypothetical protein VLX91_02225 [Candidatus Acidoferrales bacterium]|nr:hypothetical protein [Candidatus Acidoferrales bacterium]
MKILLGLLVLATVLMVNSCSSKKPTIAVGMTYDEVEKALGKPSQIARGVNQLHPDEQWADAHHAMMAKLAYFIWTTGELNVPTSDEEMVKEIVKAEERGMVKEDKLLYSIFPSYGHFTRDSLAQHLDGLYFSRAADLCGKDTLAWACPQSVETTGQLIYVTWKYPETKTDTSYAYQFRLTITPTGIGNTPPVKICYVINEQHCVMFDVSSGRVVAAGYQPISVVACEK